MLRHHNLWYWCSCTLLQRAPIVKRCGNDPPRSSPPIHTSSHRPIPALGALSRLASSYAAAAPRSRILDVDAGRLRRLDLAEGAFPPSPAVTRALRATQRASIAELPDREALRLRRAVATYLQVTPENVVVLAGADEAIDLIPRTYLNPDETALTVVPTFGRLVRTSEKVGARVVFHVLREDGGFTLGRKEAGALADDVGRTGAKVAWLCSPGNPTGTPIEPETVASLARANPAVLFAVDEAYQEYVSLDPGRSCASLIGARENVIVLRTFSKAFGLAGARVGYAVASERRCAELRTLQIAFSTSSVSQELAVAALGDLPYVERLARRVKAERVRLERLVDASAALVYSGRSVSNILLLRHRDADLHALLAAHGILSLDLRGSPGLSGGNYVRVAIGRREDNDLLRRAIRAIGELR